MKIEIKPNDIKYKIQVAEGKFLDMAGSLVKIKGHEVGVGPRIGSDAIVYVVLTDLRTGISLFKFPLTAIEMALGGTRELALELYEIKINLLTEEQLDYIFKMADRTLDKYAKAPAYEELEEVE